MTPSKQLDCLSPDGDSGAPSWIATPSGDSCLILEFASVLSVYANRQAATVANLLGQAMGQGALTGVTDIVPGMVTVGIHYLPEAIEIHDADVSPYATLVQEVSDILLQQSNLEQAEPRRIEIPVCYGGEYGPDLEEVAAACGLSPQALIELHSSQWLDVMMMGFAPGNPYIGVLDARLNPARRSTPRTLVPRGSIGLANRQSVIYPLDLPGGWSLIGRTPLSLFDAQREQPCLLRSGDKVRFVPIQASTFDSLARGA